MPRSIWKAKIRWEPALIRIKLKLSLYDAHDVRDIIADDRKIERPQNLQDVDDRCRKKGESDRHANSPGRAG
ncbi:hypothetical protein D3C76_1660030 [compost metagenome]